MLSNMKQTIWADPAMVAGNVYKLVLENERVRVFDVQFKPGLKAVEELRPLVPPDASMAQLALRWILMSDAVSCAVPGARRLSQLEENIAAASLPPLSEADMQKIRAIYQHHIRASVHSLW